MEQPSVKAEMMATCLSKGRTFIGRDPKGWGIGPRDSSKSRQKPLYCRTAVIASGRDPGSGDCRGGAACRRPSLRLFGFLGSPDSNRDCRDRNSGRPTVRPIPRLVRADLQGPFAIPFEGSLAAALPLSLPLPRRLAALGSYPPIHVCQPPRRIIARSAFPSSVVTRNFLTIVERGPIYGQGCPRMGRR